MSDQSTSGTERKTKIGELYDLMMELSEEHDSDDALLEKRDETTTAVVLEFDIPERSNTPGNERKTEGSDHE